MIDTSPHDVQQPSMKRPRVFYVRHIRLALSDQTQTGTAQIGFEGVSMIPYTTIPFVSAICLVLVGVLIGQLFWSRIRREYQRFLGSMSQQVVQQRQELHLSQSQRDALREQADAATRQVNDHESELQALRHTLDQIRTQHASAVASLGQETQTRKDMAACLADERRQRSADINRLTEELEIAARHLEEADGRTEEQRERNRELTAKNEQLQLRLQAALDEHDRLRASLHDQSEFAIICQQEQQEFQAHAVELNRKNSLLFERVRQLEGMHDEAQAEVVQSNEQLRALTLRIESLEQERVRLTNDQVTFGQQSIAQHDAMAARLETTERRCVELADQLSAANQATAELSRLQAAMEQLQLTSIFKDRELSALVKQLNVLRAEQANTQQAKLQLQQQLEAQVQANRHWQSEIERSERLVVQLEASKAAVARDLQSARKELDRLALVEDQLVETDALRQQLKEECRQLRRQQEDARDVEMATRSIVAELRDELNDSLTSIDVLRRERESTDRQLEFERRERIQVDEALHQAESRIAALQSENDVWNQRHEKLVAQVARLNDESESHQVRVADLERQLSASKARNAELAEVLGRQQQQLRQTAPNQVRLGGVLPSAEGSNGLAFSFREMRCQDGDGSRDESLVLDGKLGKIYAAPPERWDDLKKISGIADRVEEQLHQLGIYTYRQLMEWSPLAIAEVSRRLELGDLVRTHDWVGQARRLYRDRERSAA